MLTFPSSLDKPKTRDWMNLLLKVFSNAYQIPSSVTWGSFDHNRTIEEGSEDMEPLIRTQDFKPGKHWKEIWKNQGLGQILRIIKTEEQLKSMFLRYVKLYKFELFKVPSFYSWLNPHYKVTLGLSLKKINKGVILLTFLKSTWISLGRDDSLPREATVRVWELLW